nr:hypothetical protein [Clostridia bacterium]
MKKFAFFSDILFTFFVSFLFTLCLFRYLGVKLAPAVALAALCGLLTAAAVGSILQIRRKNLHLKKSDETQKEKLLLHLALLSDEGKTDFARHFLSSEETPVNRFSRLRVCSPSEFYFLKFSLAPVNADEIARLSRFKTGKQKILLCSQIEENANSLCSRLGIQVKTGEWVYRQVKEKSLLPEHYLGDDSGVRKTKRKVKLWFAKSNAKRFLVGGALVLLLARLTPFYYYYLLLGCLLLLAAIFVRIFGYV